MKFKPTSTDIGPSLAPVMGRKVVQISSSIDSVGKYFILALCDDGTLWQLSGLYEAKIKWDPFPIP